MQLLRLPSCPAHSLSCRPLTLATALAMVLGAFLAFPPSAVAAEVTTKYPVVSVEPGQTATFDLTVRSDGSERVGLSVGRKPKGWSAIIRGGGSRIGAVHTTPGSAPQVQLTVDVPDDAKPGAHRVVVLADAPSGDDRLVVSLEVARAGAGGFELTSEFPTLQGASDDTFTYDVELANNSGQQATFGLTARGPAGWSVDASPSLEAQASAVTVDAGSSATITVEADPPDNVPAGTYPIRLRARGEGATLETRLTAEITGSPDLTLETASERLNASGPAGETTKMKVLVRNEGTAPLKAVELSASPPTDWEVSFEPERIAAVPPGQAVPVTVQATPAGNAIAGDYMLTLTASGEASDDSIDVRYAVQTSGWWGLVGVLVIAAAVVGLLWTFRRFGRR